MAQDFNNDPFTPYPSTEEVSYGEVVQPKSRAPSAILIAVLVLLVLMCCCCVFILLFYFVIGDILTDSMGLTWQLLSGLVV